MPTFKAEFAHYDVKKGNKENLILLIEQYNDLVQRLTFTINDLDEDNLTSSILKQIKEQEGTHGTN